MYCDKDFIQNSILKQHTKSCSNNVKILKQKILKQKQKSEIDILLLTQRVKDLEIIEDKYDNLVKTLATRPTTTKNTINNNLNLTVFNKTQADIKRLVEEKYDTNYLLQGQKGVARFTHSHLLNIEEGKDPMYIITDKNRGNGKYKTSKGEIVSDNGMSGLTKKVYPSVKDKACRLALIEKAMENQNIYDNFQDVIRLGEDNTDFRKEMVKLVK